MKGPTNTKEPWYAFLKHADGPYVITSGILGHAVLIATVERMAKVEDACNAHRIVNCVNACAKLENPKEMIPQLLKALTWANDALLHIPEETRSAGAVYAIREARSALALAQTKGDE